jgi:hypothetical protein
MEKRKNSMDAHPLSCIYYYCSATMNNWRVSGITDFSSLFYSVKIFNEPIDNWDVSSGTTFVSNNQGIQFNSIHCHVWLSI